MGRISALTELTSLASDDYLVVLDSSANIAKKISIANAFGIPTFGWTATGESWTYASWTSGTRIGTITVPTDATTKYKAGDRIKITQSTGGTKYGIIVLVAATLLTVFFPTGTTLNNEAITTPFYALSGVNPLGFPTDKVLWGLELSDTSQRSQTTPTVNTWYNIGSQSLAVGPGIWDVGYTVSFQQNLSTGTATIQSALSNANNTAAYADLQSSPELSSASTVNSVGFQISQHSTKNFASATTLYINGRYITGGTNGTLYFRGDKSATRIYAYCALL